MRSHILLLTFVVACYTYGNGPAAPPTREGCPPAGFTAISSQMKLDRLPKNGRYAICQTQSQSLQDQFDQFDFNFTGVFKLTDSLLIVDNNIQLFVNWPARLEWSNVQVTVFPDDDELSDGDWWGIKFFGQYNPEDPKCPEERGHCANLNKVNVDGVDASEDIFAFHNCSGKTTLKSVTAHGAVSPRQGGVDVGDGYSFSDCNGIVAYDLAAVGRTQFFDGISISRSQMAFIRPKIFAAADDGFQVRRGSHVTVCDGFITVDDDDYRIGETDDEDTPSSVAVAGGTSFFDQDVVFLGAGGILYTLKSCPQELRATYDQSMWSSWFSG